MFKIISIKQTTVSSIANTLNELKSMWSWFRQRKDGYSTFLRSAGVILQSYMLWQPSSL